MGNEDVRTLVARFQKAARSASGPRIVVAALSGHEQLAQQTADAFKNAGFHVVDGSRITTSEDAARRATREYVDAICIVAIGDHEAFAAEVSASLAAKQREHIVITMLNPRESIAQMVAGVIRTIQIAKAHVIWPLLAHFETSKPDAGGDRLHDWLRIADDEVTSWGADLQCQLPQSRRDAISEEAQWASTNMIEYMQSTLPLPRAVWLGLFLSSERPTDPGTLKTYMIRASNRDVGSEWFCSKRLALENYIALPKLTEAHRPAPRMPKAITELLGVVLPVGTLVMIAEGVLAAFPDLKEISFGWDSGDVFTWRRD